MPFTKFSSEFASSGTTVVDNSFLHDYMAEAPECYVKIYLYGLYQCGLGIDAVNSEQNMLTTLRVTREQTLDAFGYWEEMGIVSVESRDPLEVRYLPLKDTTVRTRRIRPEKYSDFSKQVQLVLKERMITPNEFNEYYTAIEMYGIQPEAMVMIITYCTSLKGINVSYKYILTVARNFAHRGILTEEDVTRELSSYTKQSRDVKRILTALKSKRNPDTEDNELYNKWTKEFGFDIDNILHAVSLMKDKKGGMKKLDALITEYYRHKAFTVSEMTAIAENKAMLAEVAVSVNRQLGLWYDVIDPVIVGYTQPWFNMGFDRDGIMLIASYCMKKGIRTLEGMDNILKALFKQGIVETETIKRHFVNLLNRDKRIKNILTEAGLNCVINNWHRENYATWSEVWGLSDELITYAASISCGKVNPIPYMNAILGNWKNAGILTVEEAKKVAARQQPQSAPSPLTEGELEALIDDVDTLEI